MYTGFTHLHKMFFYIVFAILVVSTVKFILGWLGKKEFMPIDKKLATFTVIVVHIQVLIGLGLYFISPLIKSAYQDIGAAMKDASVRFYLVEHMSLMIIGAVLITIGSIKSKKATESQAKFKTLALFFSIGFVLVLSRIPWERIF
mgnify:FL=1|tara:strand:+ start:1277 stop:1711 length:435 start_codon:yes stop_codon:yes gene_type:complete